VIAESPEAAPGVLTCAWCEQPTAPALHAVAVPGRCSTCGARTEHAWSSEEEADDELMARRGGSGGIRFWPLGEAVRDCTRRRLAARVARAAPSGPVLAVGVGDRVLLEALRRAGRLVTSVDRAASHEADVTHVGGRYAAVVFWHSLGRLPAPALALEHGAALLKPGGLLAVAQPHRAMRGAHALAQRRLPRDLPRQRVQIPRGVLIERLRRLGLQVESAGLLAASLRQGGIVSIVARRDDPPRAARLT
jgi:hypothetical protein